ncbi:MAG: hypothetical protein NC253_00510 [Ruminococcus sp.]|nr:hypothetical protein [Ruminococcus sp.]MCM1380602.1 hypothetical protein [Muribaculaceae bacterium]MCM1478108.1 hypothetical protein [Muribaculaceae bacterium]
MDYSLTNEGIYSKYAGDYVKVKNQEEGDTTNGYLDFDGYLQLLVAQMSNQDFNDPMSDSDLLNQMAQYSMLEGIKDMTQQTAISYAASLVGKTVTVSDGTYYHTGVINSIAVEDGKPSIMVDGQAFKSGDITDIVTNEDYEALQEWLGKTVTLKSNSADDDSVVKGKVAAVVFRNGEGYASVNGNTYAVSLLKVIEDGDDTSEEDNKTEGVEGTDGGNGDSENAAENGSVPAETDTDTDTETNAAAANAFKVGEVEESKSASYAASADALTDMLMRELDRVDAAKNSVNAVEEKSLDGFDLEEIMKTAAVQVNEYAASAMVDGDDLLLSAVEGRTVYANADSSVSGVGNVSISDYNKVTGTGSLVDENYTEVITADDDTPTVTNTTVNYTTTTYTDPTVPQYTASGKLKGVTVSQPGIATSDGIPHRISVEQYPEEAALADEYGTRMYDIRYINNHEITSRIKTGPVITYTASGRGVTEIGYSGMGQLGEVVTFEDGTQRVEILLKSGKSCWLTTSGTRTLDQICTTNGLPGSLADMTPAEKAIRNYSQANDIQLARMGYTAPNVF